MMAKSHIYAHVRRDVLHARTPPDVDTSSSSTSSSADASPSPATGGGNDKSGSNISLPVALGVIIPIVLAIIIFVYLHRRHVKRLRQEDANDPHKSLDFGWDPASKPAKKHKKGAPRAIVTDLGATGLDEKALRSGRDRGLSMDMDVGSPYLLPPGVHGSRESMRSIGRTINSQPDDRYRPLTTLFAGQDAASLRSASRTPRPVDDVASLRHSPDVHLRPPQPTASPAPDVNLPEPIHLPRSPTFPLPSQVPSPSAASHPLTGPSPPGAYPNDSARNSFVVGDDGDPPQPQADFQHSQTYLSRQNQEPEQVQPTENLYYAPKSTDSPLPPLPSQSARVSAEQNFYDASSGAAEHVPTRGSSQEYMPPVEEYGDDLQHGDYGYDINRLSMGVRPLPPDDPSDNPEQRANRIRSFYKEYFDESKPAPAGANYYEDYDEYYLGEGGAIYDEETGQFYTSDRHDHYGRQAMTPPPTGRGPRRRRHAATMSAGIQSTQSSTGPRTYSSVSGRFGPPAYGHGAPKKRLPPPAALRVLPTPHMLKEDAFALPIDFAPPRSARDRQAGRPDSPRGGLRPYSPGVRAHTPLARSYDDLAVMPSPHSLRKSGTFTALDFAPPPRFRNADSVSDAGSIRSNRSGMSARSQHAVRNGAYRVSRIPQEIVGTKSDLMGSLKPQWNMHNNTGTIGMPVQS